MELEVKVKNLKNEMMVVKPTLLWGDVLLFSSEDSVNFLEMCEKFEVPILGVEGFRIANGKRMPDMECILDLSVFVGSEEGRISSLKVAREFVGNLFDSDLFFEFVVMDE